MTKEQAISIIDQALSQLQASRDVHVRLQQALNVLSQLEEGNEVTIGGLEEAKKKDNPLKDYAK